MIIKLSKVPNWFGLVHYILSLSRSQEALLCKNLTKVEASNMFYVQRALAFLISRFKGVPSLIPLAQFNSSTGGWWARNEAKVYKRIGDDEEGETAL